MIARITRGRNPGSLLQYLYGPGRANEHVNPHLVASWDGNPAALEPIRVRAGGFALHRLTSRLMEPLAAAPRISPRPVWHCSIRVAPADRQLTDAEFGEIARDVMHATGLARRDVENGCRYAAVRHADHHIHLVATLAFQDGRQARLWNDFYSVADACRSAEQRLKLTSSPPRDRSAAHQATRAEIEKAARLGRQELPRATLTREVRIAAAGAASPSEFLDRLTSAGLLWRVRREDQDPSVIVGYAVGLPGDRDANHRAVLFGGGRLAADLSWPKVSSRWPEDARPPGSDPYSALGAAVVRLSPPERLAAWRDAGAAVSAARAAVAELAGRSDAHPRTVSDLAHATADLMSVIGRVVEGRRGGPLTAAADLYDRAGREPYGRIPEPTLIGGRLRAAARALARGGLPGRVDGPPVRTLVEGLADLSDAVALLRTVQQRPAQASAAGRAGERLRTAVPPVPSTAAVSPAAALLHQTVDGHLQHAPMRPAALSPAPARSSPARRRG